MDIKMDEKVQKIIYWREYFTLLPEERFFEIMRTYLGHIQTPYNKTNLIEKLSSIFRKAENKQTLVSYLTEFDKKMITAISLINCPTQVKITEFFKNEYSLSQVYAELLSLNERLIIFSYKEKDSDKRYIAINPLIEEDLSPYIKFQTVLNSDVCVSRNFDASFSLSPLFIASFLSYIQDYPEMCKNDMSIKKKDLSRLEMIFPGKIKCLQLLLIAFVNLGIVRFNEKEISLDKSRIQKFSELPECFQYAYLSTASAVHLGRTSMRQQTQTLLDIVASIPSTGFTKSSMLKTLYLLESRNENRIDGSFNRMLEARRSFSIEQSDVDNEQSFSSVIMERVIDSASEFGFLSIYGKTENDEFIYTKGNVLINEERKLDDDAKKGMLNINAGTNVTLMPGLSLSELYILIGLMEIRNCNTVAEFEITRKSISRSFDDNLKPEDIYDILNTYNAYRIPQSLQMNIEEWYKSYSSAMLYKGYVLQVDERTSRLVEKNPKILPFIQKQLAPGVYLLNINPSDNPDVFIETCGLESLGNVKIPKKEKELISYPTLRNGESYIQLEEDFVSEQSDELLTKGDELRKKFYEILNNIEVNKDERECLEKRIEKGVILTESQISSEYVRVELLEADGMNYAGKLRLIENAVSKGDMIELTLPLDNDVANQIVYLGKPLLLTKNSNDAIVQLNLEPQNETRFFSVGKANKVKLIKTSIFN